MPRYNKRRYKHRSRPQRRAITYAQIGSKIYKDVAYLKRLINVEFKSFLLGPPNTCSTTVTISNLTAIAQGDDFLNRDGRKIRLKSISLRGNMRQNASATITRARLMVVRDNNGSTTQPVVTDLFSDAASYFGNRHKLDDPQHNSRFTVLMDRTFDLSDTGIQSYQWSWYKELDHHVYFTGTAATDEGKGHIYLFSASNEATNVPINEMDSVVKFIDN